MSPTSQPSAQPGPPPTSRLGQDDAGLRRTVLHGLHLRHGGRFGSFAGWDMPIRYGPGPIAEHQHCRSRAALFDVSHMTVLDVSGPEALTGLERLVPAQLGALAVGQLKYSFFTNDAGGILDDVMITKRAPESVRIVLNADGTDADIDYLRAELASSTVVQPRRDLALVALQGPVAAEVLGRASLDLTGLAFMREGSFALWGHEVELSRSGYTGGEGFELALPAEQAEAIVEGLLQDPDVALAGLAARDSLRLEAGLCLYGHDLDPTTTPVEAGLAWAIPASRRHGEAGYRGAGVIAAQLNHGPTRHRVGLRPDGRRPLREGAELVLADRHVGRVTSGGYSPVLGGPIAMGYVDTEALETTNLLAVTSGRTEACRIVALPFIPKDYRR